MNLKVNDTIKQYAMLKQGDTVITAVSGGADSVALLHILSTSELRLSVRACHINHCLRGAESDRDEQLVRTMCREYGVPLDVRRAAVARIAKRKHQSIELAARETRYNFFSELATHYSARVATAHTLSDSAETILFNLARGTGIDGMCGIPPVREPYIRPMLACSRSEIERYCELHDITYTNDATNSLDDYTRNYIRHNVVPPLLISHDGALQAMDRTSQLMRSDANFLNMQALERRQAYSIGNGICAKKLREEHPAMRSRILMQIFHENKIEISALRVTQAEDVLFERSGALCIGKGLQILVQNDILQICRVYIEPSATFEVRQFDKNTLNGKHFSLENGRLLFFSIISAEEYEVFKNNGHIDLNYALDYDKMEKDIVMRPRQSGDRICLAGRGCSKTLKKLYNELALSARGSRCVLADQQGVFFAEGAGIDARVAPKIDSQQILTVKIMEEWEYDAGYQPNID